MSATWSHPRHSKPRSRGSRPVRVAAVTALCAAALAAAWIWPMTFVAEPERLAVLWGVCNTAVLWLAATWDKP